MIGVIDTCFLIDWSRFRKREILEKLFNVLLIHEEVLRQIRSESAIEYVSELFTKGVLRLYPWSNMDEKEFIILRSQVSSNSRIPSLERPDLLCLIMTYNSDAVLLSENVGIHRVVQYHPRYSHVKVWIALDVIEQSIYRGLINVDSEEDFLSIVKEYELDTHHSFRKNKVRSATERVREWLMR